MIAEEPAAEVVLAPTTADTGLARVHSGAHGAGRVSETAASGDLTGQVVLIAGALGQVALGIADGFWRRGATTLLAPGAGFDPDEVALHEAHIVIADANHNPASLERCCDEVSARYGQLDLIILCSGALTAESGAAMPSAPALVPGRSSGRTSLARGLFERLLGRTARK